MIHVIAANTGKGFITHDDQEVSGIAFTGRPNDVWDVESVGDGDVSATAWASRVGGTVVDSATALAREKLETDFIMSWPDYVQLYPSTVVESIVNHITTVPAGYDALIAFALSTGYQVNIKDTEHTTWLDYLETNTLINASQRATVEAGNS